MFNCTVPGPVQPSLWPPMAGSIGSQCRVVPISFYVWNMGTFHLSGYQKSRWADQPCILHIPGINGIIRTEKAGLIFSPSAYCIHLPSPAYYYCPTSVKDLKRKSNKIDTNKSYL
jgi:hypothetical protein